MTIPPPSPSDQYTIGGQPPISGRHATTKKARQYLLALMVFCFCCIAPAIAGTSNEYWAPWVTTTTTNSATINWRGASNGVGSIAYATSSYYNDHQCFEKTNSSQITNTYQHVQLAGLEPNTSYIYRVRPSGHESIFSNRTFRTMPVSGPFTFIVISDSQEGHNYTEEKRFKYVAEAIAKETNVLFILHGGDYAGHDSKDLWATFFQVADVMLAKFAVFSTIGNHEYHDGGTTTGPTTADQYHWSFDIGMGLPLNYSFDCSGIRFVILDSPDPNNANGDDPQTSLALAQSQAPWLSNQLDNAMLGTFTIHHHPIWDDGRTNMNYNLEPWEALYHTYKISATFAGHTHNYQRFLVEGIPYFIVGIAGGRCADLTGPDSVWYQFGETRKLGYLKVSVDPAKNMATAQEIVAASVQEDDSDETPQVYDPPLIDDTVTFPLKINETAMNHGDYDGDGKSDLAVYQDGYWSIYLMAGSVLLNNVGVWGGPGWVPVRGDYDGDGKSDLAVYKDGYWSIYSIANGVILSNVGVCGGAYWIPVPGDYDGDGKSDLAVYKDGYWSIFSLANGTILNNVGELGGTGWIPVPGDYDGDGKSDLAVYKDGYWSIYSIANGVILNNVGVWGGPGWTPVPGDYNGDNKSDLAIHKDGYWSIYSIANGIILNNVGVWGGAYWTPVPGDYDADSKSDLAVYREGYWSIYSIAYGIILNNSGVWGGAYWTPVQ